MVAQRFNEMTRVAIISCCKVKMERPAPAKNFYCSQLFTATRRYVEREIQRGNLDGWFVLSAKHGLIEPEQIVEPYDVTLAKMSSAAKVVWSDQVVADIRRRWKHPELCRFSVFAGMLYAQPFNHFPRTVFPLAGEGIGDRLKFFKQQFEAPVRELVQSVLFV